MKLPESVQDALKYGGDCNGMIKVGVFAGGSDSGADGYTLCGAEWFVAQNGGRAVVGRAGDLLSSDMLEDLGLEPDDTVTLAEAQ